MNQLIRILSEEGLGAAVSSCGVAAGKWWRRGEVWQIHKSDYVRLDGCRIGLADTYPSSLISLLSRGVFEKPEREAIRRFLRPDVPVVELGACIGVVACTTNRLLKFPNRHIVVEANPKVIPYLLSNRDRNGCEFEVINAAIAYGSATIDFHVNDANVLASSVQAAGTRTVCLPATTLGELVEHRKFHRFTLVCDIEAMEAELFEREAELLSGRADLMIVEVHERMLGEQASARLFKKVNDMGFDPVWRSWETHVFRNANRAVKEHHA